MNWDVWGPSIVVLSLGLVAGLVMIMRSRGQVRHDPSINAWARKDSLVDQLRALRADKEKVDPHVWQVQWVELLDEAAAALRDAEQANLQPTVEQEVVVATESKKVRRFLWVAAVALFFVGLGATLQMGTQERSQGGSMTGGAIVSGPSIDSTIQKLEEEAASNPNSIDPRNKLAHIAIQRGDMGSAMKWMDEARALDGDHPHVRTHLAILQTSIGMTDRAKGELDAALAADPEMSEALLWKGIIALRAGDRDAAVSILESALEHAESREERMMATSALSEARKPPATTKIKGQVGLGNNVTVPNGGVLFIMVRRTAEGSGPPVAALRLSPRGVPGTFAVTDRDMMLGGPWPEQVWVSARIDTDGNPTTKQPTDLLADTVGPFSAGADDVVLTLEGTSSSPTESKPSDTRVGGTIEMGEGVALPEAGAVFIIVRRSPTPAGPPVAAVRLRPSDVPGPFSVGDSNIMMGGPWPDQVWVQVRADSDGNAMTKDEKDPSSELIGPVSSGTKDLVLTLGL